VDRRKAIGAIGPPLLAVAVCGGVFATAMPAGAAVAATTTRRSGCAQAAQRVAASSDFARGRYRLESRGAAARAAAARVAGDRVLVDALAGGDLRAADAEALRLVAAPGHVTSIRVRRGGRVLVATQRYPFDVAGARATLRDHLGTVDVTIQDVIGFIRLVRKFTGSDVVVRGSRGQARSSLAAALETPLPATGCMAIGGRSYAVRSFSETDFDGQALRIWVLRDHR
jgi:hypothetical protein